MEKTKKQLKAIRRRETLEEAASSGLAICTHHSYPLTPRDIKKHRCYIGNHGTNYCKYLRIDQDEKKH